MIPIRDEIPTRRVPVVNYLLIAVNILVFVLMWLAGPSQEALVYQLAMIPPKSNLKVNVCATHPY
jgi:membrane associated rhomboid family serine protease